MHPVAARRILRLSLGTALCLLASQIFNWPLSFIAPVLTLTVLGLPMPAPGLKGGVGFVLALLAPLVLGLGLVPLLIHARWAGIILLALAFFYGFYFTARGGSPILGTFVTIGLTLVVTIGSVNPHLLAGLVMALAMNAVAGVLFVWIAHGLLPDLPEVRAGARRKPPKPTPPPGHEARRRAWRSLVVVLPLVMVFLFISGSPAYTVVMIKVAAMGQEACVDSSRAMGRSLIASTFWGGAAAVVAWNLLGLWPALTFYILLIAVAGLLFGRRIFQGPAVHPDFSQWSYAFLTLVVLLAPAVLDSPFSSSAGNAFWTRLALFGLIGVYGTAAVAVFDTFWPARQAAGKERALQSSAGDG